MDGSLNSKAFEGRRYLIVDLEGTLANNSHRISLLHTREFDEYEARSHEDMINHDVADLITSFFDCETDVIVISTRSEKYRNAVERWLNVHNMPVAAVLLRPPEDWTPEHLLKARMIQEFFDGKAPERVIAVMDDNDQVCVHLREEGYVAWHRL